jgi:hypothetical protein
MTGRNPMALHRTLIEILRVSGSMFMLFCFAAAFGALLLITLLISVLTSLARRNRALTQAGHGNYCGGSV